MYDLIIKDGQIYDGDGGIPYIANVGIKDGKIAEIGACDAGGKDTIDAAGHIVTPGFIDLHTHYDGQVSWDEELRPSVNHGVTTAVLGNCGVGFAPCRKADRDRLVRLMEGVEDIPGTALHEGLTWDWETFPEYMDAIDALPHTIDFAVMVPHDPLRVYAMGDRALANEPATKDDIDAMRAAMSEAIDAGAIGFSTGRSDFHKTSDGDWTPASEAGKSELMGIADVLGQKDIGVLQAVSDFDMIRPGDNNFEREFDLIESYFRAGGNRPGSMSLMQRDFVPDDWKNIIKRSEKLKNEDGLDIRFQVAPRAIGSFLGLGSTFHPLMAFPSYIAIQDKSLAEKVEIMRDPAYKAQMLSETPVQLSGPGSPIPPMTDMLIAGFEQVAGKLFRLNDGDGVNYEPEGKNSLAAKANEDGVGVWEKAYDMLLEDDGKSLIYYPVYNYTEGNYNNVMTMMRHPQSLPGLSDGGAHVGFICDASFPTFLLSYWARDRPNAGKSGFDVARTVQMLTADCADFLELKDRGRIKVGQKADINVIDHAGLTLGVPEMTRDLPAGGQRLLQPVSGYKATFVSGEQVIANDNVTTARPGRLVRAGH